MPMQSRTDQVHSYEFFLQRIISGLVARESDPAELPFRRLGWSGFGSVMVAIVVAAVFGIIGVLRGGANTEWQEDKRIVVEKGTGNVYLYINERLHPMTNMVSAQLATGGGEVEQVSARSLEGVRRGATLGIPGLPHRFPDGDNLLSDAWTLCSQGETETISVLGVGVPPAAGEPVADRAVLVHDLDRDVYHMVWNGYRFEIDTDIEVQDATLAALGVSAGQALPVQPAWVDAVPEGTRLAPPSVEVVGDPTSEVDDDEVLTGDVVRDGDRLFLVDRDQLIQLTTLEADILVDRLQVQQHDISLTGNENTEDLPSPPPDASPPQDRIPAFVPGAVLGRSACLVFRPGAFEPEVVAGGELDATTASETPRRGPAGEVYVDYVDVPGGAAMLVQAISAPDAPGAAWYIVNDQGIRFALRDADVAPMLGYEPGQGVRMSDGLVGLLPPGPSLDPAAAGPASGGAS